MKINRTTTALAIAAGALVVGAVTPAGAAETAPQGVGVAANAPKVTSGPDNGYKVRYLDKYEATNCPKEYICLSVWDTTRSPDQWKVFDFKTCGIYNVAYWEGDGYWENNQTGNAYGTFYTGFDGTGERTNTKPAPPRVGGKKNWTPVNSVRPCS